MSRHSIACLIAGCVCVCVWKGGGGGGGGPPVNNSLIIDLCSGNPPITGGLPSQMPVMGKFDVLFVVILNKQLSTWVRRLLHTLGRWGDVTWFRDTPQIGRSHVTTAIWWPVRCRCSISYMQCGYAGFHIHGNTHSEIYFCFCLNQAINHHT